MVLCFLAFTEANSLDGAPQMQISSVTLIKLLMVLPTPASPEQAILYEEGVEGPDCQVLQAESQRQEASDLRC